MLLKSSDFKPKKNSYITIKATLAEKKLIKLMATEAGLDLSKYIRSVALNKNIKARLTDQEIEMFKELIKLHNSLKSIGNLFGIYNPETMKVLHSTADQLKEKMKKFQ